MSRVHVTTAIAAIATLVLTAAPPPAQAQFVKGNEAVKVLPDGTRKVELPPIAGAALAPPCPASRVTCAGSGWRVAETRDGLQACTELYARPGTCRPSTYGTARFPRLWIAKSKGQWMLCRLPDLTSKCVKLTALPYPAVQ
jgi:hypothetical protein